MAPRAAALWCALLAATTAAAAPPAVLTSYALASLDPDSGLQRGALATLSPAAGLVARGPPFAVGAPLAPCATALIPSSADGGTLVIPANLTSLVFVGARNGSVLRTLPLRPAYALPFLAHNPADGLLYSIGMSVDAPTAFLEVVRVDPATGAVAPVGMTLTDNVLECAASLDAASGVLAYGYTGPLQLQALAGVVLAPGSRAQPFDALVANGSVLALATLPGGSSDGGATPGVLFLSTDSNGSMWALMLLDAATGNATALAPLPLPLFVNPAQGALVYDARSRTAFALAQYVNETGAGAVDVLMSFDLTGFTWKGGVPSLPYGGAGAFSYVELADAAAAPQGLWGLALQG
jgi:hypothetical protein